MKQRVYAVIIATLVVTLTTGCVEPKDRRPGTRIRGDVVTEAVTDWSFSNDVQEIFLETRTWYGLPHSVTTVCAALGDRLYVPSVYFEGGGWPDKFWNSNVVSDPRVRVKIGDRVYPRSAVVIEEESEREAALRALAAKYPFWQDQLSKPEGDRFDMALIRLDPRPN